MFPSHDRWWLTRTLTDANIRRQFGTLEDFSVSSLSSQHGALAFIDEGSTRRKEIIAKFLDLEQFERKFKLAKEDSVDLKGAIKRLEDKNFDEEIEAALITLSDYRVKAEQNKAACALLKTDLATLTDKHNTIKNQIENIPAEFVDIHKLLNEQQDKAYQVVELATKIKKQTESITNKSQGS